jgi:hypothetical protein
VSWFPKIFRKVVDFRAGWKINGVTVTATANQINAAAAPTAATVPVADAGGRYAGENVEACLQEIAGAGRVGETVKQAADDAAAAAAAAATADGKAVAAQGTADAAGLLAAAKYALPVGGIPDTDLAAAVQALLALAGTALQTFNLLTATPVNAVAATGTLTIAGVVIDGETVTIGGDVYEFCTDAAQSLTPGSDFAVDIEANADKAQGTLTVDTQPTAGDTMTIGAKVYTFVPDGTANADGEVSIGTNLGTAQANIVAAINGTDGHNAAHPLVSAAAFAANDCVITAFIGGTAGNSIATTETFTAGTNVFDAAVLGTTQAGTDCANTDAVTALVTSITTNDTQGVGAADGGGGTVGLTADIRGAAANAIATTEAMANGSFGAGTLAGGVDGTVGTQWELKVDASYLYVCVAANDVTGRNWRRITIGAAY